MNAFDLKDRVAIVTGGAQGIGLAVANRILASGGRVALWDRDRALLDKTVASIGKPESVHGLAADIADLAAVEAATKATIAHFGKIDILVNNAAIVGPNAPTWEYPPEAFRDVVNVGLIGTFYCCRAVVPHMIAANYGRIVNLSSVAGKEGNPKAPAYSSMKAAVIGLTKSLGKELATYNIAVNCVTPAVAKTTLALSQAPDFLAMIVSKIPRGRMLELDEAASMICWLSSAENSFTTGAVFDLFGRPGDLLIGPAAKSRVRLMKLYYTPGACSLAPHIVLEEVGAPFELSRVDLANNQQNSTEYLRINPKARVPALTDGDWILTEAPAILRYVAARHPAAGLWPWDPREEARCAEWLNWLSSTIQVAFTHVRRAARYASDARAVEDVAVIGKKTCRELWQTVDEKVGEGPWAIGERYSVADPLLLVYWTWGRGPVLSFDMEREFPRWTAHARRIATRSAVQRAFASEGLTLPS